MDVDNQTCVTAPLTEEIPEVANAIPAVHDVGYMHQDMKHDGAFRTGILKFTLA